MNKINYVKNGNQISIECFDNGKDPEGWGERLCECVLDGAPWTEVVARGEYVVKDVEEMETLLRFIKAFNAADMDNEDLNNAINDWTILI